MRLILKNLDGIEIKESWKWDIDQLKDEMNELRRKIRQAEKERKEQPRLLVKDIEGEYMLLTSYRIGRNLDGSPYLIAESRRKPTQEEIDRVGEEE